jgi:hypothetical protein
MAKPWIVELTDAEGLIDIADYDHYREAKDIADQWWDEPKVNPAMRSRSITNSPLAQYGSWSIRLGQA